MPITQRKRSFKLFKKLNFYKCSSGSGSDDSNLEIEDMMHHTIECLAALQCMMGKFDQSKARIFWGAISTIAEIGMDSSIGNPDKRHPGATHLLRTFPSDDSSSSWLPLHWASVSNKSDVNDVWKIARADPLATIKGFNRPLSANPGHLVAAVRNPNMDIVKCLYNFYPRMACTRDNDGDLPIHYASRYTQSVDMIKFLLQHNPSSTMIKGEGGMIPLHCSLFNETPNRLMIVKCLLEANSDAAKITSLEGDTALHIAVDQDCDREILQLLIDSYPDAAKITNDVGLLPLHLACYSKVTPRTKDIVDLLLKAYPNAACTPGSSGHSPAHYAAEFSGKEVLNAILSLYPDSVFDKCAEDFDNTPLLKAISSSNEETVQYIVQTFPNSVNFENSLGLNPLHFAAENESIHILELLYSVNPDNIRKKDKKGRLPIHIFAQDHQDFIVENDKEADCVRFLLRHYPESIVEKDRENRTPYSYCNENNIFIKRIMLRVNPSLDPKEFKRLNYNARRMGLFLAYSAINADGIPNVYSMLREKESHLLKNVLSYL